jgi:hypothetical protein
MRLDSPESSDRYVFVPVKVRKRKTTLAMRRLSQPTECPAPTATATSLLTARRARRHGRAFTDKVGNWSRVSVGFQERWCVLNPLRAFNRLVNSEFPSSVAEHTRHEQLRFVNWAMVILPLAAGMPKEPQAVNSRPSIV